MKSRGTNIGIILKRARNKKGLSQEFVSKELGLQSPQYISNIERGLCPASLETIRTMVELYDLNTKSIVRLLTEEYHEQISKKILKKTSA